MLDLDPRAAASTFGIRGIQPLGHHSLEPLRGCGRQHRLVRPDEVAWRDQRGPVDYELGEQLSPLHVGESPDRGPVEVKHVERHQLDHAAVRGHRQASCPPPDSSSQCGEVRFATSAETHQLAIDNYPAAAQLLGDDAEL
jgi:hypothetical protein